MFARRFLCVSLGILALSIAYHLGAQKATASIASGQIVGLWGSHAHTAAGEVWRIGPPNWTREPTWDLPVPVSEVKFIDAGEPWVAAATLITQADEAWVLSGTQWYNLGVFPGGSTASKSTTWGEIKGRFVDN